MQEVIFDVQTITPLFLAGADQETAELRAPSFRGAMRYWQRALVGGLVGTDAKGLERVMKEETALFGATDTGSAVHIRVTAASQAPNTQRFQKESFSRSNISGKDYLLWSMAQSGQGDRYKPDRLYFPQGTTFHVALATRGDDNTKLQQAIASFWLLTHLGSMGSRSRRCAGSVSAKPVEGDIADFRFDIPTNVNNLQRQIVEGIQAAQQLTSQQLHDLKLKPITGTSFDTLSKQSSKIWILQNGSQPWTSPDAAMRSIGKDLQIYRSSIPLPQRKVFGLPLKDVDNKSRRASPLLLRIVELQGNRYVGLAVLFKITDGGNYMLIEKWANNLQGKIEVML